MEITYSNIGNMLIVNLIGELDESSANATKRKLLGIIDCNYYQSITFDFSRLSFMDSTGIGVMISIYKQLKENGIKASVKGASNTIDKILTMSGLYQIFNKMN